MTEPGFAAPFYFEGRNESEECGVELDALLVEGVSPSLRGDGWSRVYYAGGAEYEAQVPIAELIDALELAREAAWLKYGRLEDEPEPESLRW